MAEVVPATCGRCGARIPGADSLCPGCLLRVGSGQDPEAVGDQLFQEALALAPEERLPFLQKATEGRPALFASVRMLLEGQAESGEDASGTVGGGIPEPMIGWAETGGEAPGTLIGHFRLVHRLGEGGMGSVWRAEQLEPVRRMVALKVIKLGMDTREVVRRFERERQTLALLNHPNIAQVYEAGATASGRPFFAMELVEGRPITTYCDEEGLELASRLRLFQSVCAAVEHAHQKGIIHRDLKPSNILVVDGRVKVIDFGIAKATQGGGETLVTRQAQILGTPAYMSPEQARSAGEDIDTRTDVYALGVVLYELLTGHLPFDSRRLLESSVAEMQRILREEDPLPPSARSAPREHQNSSGKSATGRRHELKGDLDWVVLQALRKDRNQRYAGAAAFSEDLRRHLAGEPVSAVPPSVRYQMGKFVRRHRAAVAAAVGITVAMVMATVVSVRQAVRARQAQRLTTLTVADMYTRSGLAAAEFGDPARAALWFANAAVIGREDRERTKANLARAAAWGREIRVPVRALDTQFPYVDQLLWNPRQPAMIVTAHSKPQCLVWDLEQDRLWDRGDGVVNARAVWDPSGERLALTSGSLVRVVEYPGGRELARTECGPVETMEFSPTETWLAVGDQPPFLWNWKSGERRPMALSHQKPAGIRFSPAGDSVMLTWDALGGICAVHAPGQFLHPPVPNEPSGSGMFLDRGTRFVTGTSDGAVQVRDTLTGTVIETFVGRDGAPGFPQQASPDSRFIARANSTVLDRETHQAAGFPFHRNTFDAAAFNPDGTLLATGGYDDTLRLWSLPDGRSLGQVGQHQHAVLSLAFSPDGSLLASSQDGLVRLWRVQRAPVVRPIDAGGDTLAVLSRDGRLLAPSGITRFTGDLRRTRVLDPATGQPVGPELDPSGVIMDAVFDPAGTWLSLAVSTTSNRMNESFAASPGAGNLQFWDFRSGRRLGDPVLLPSEPRGIAVHPSGQWVGVCGAGGEGLECAVAGRHLNTLFNDHQILVPQATLNNGRCAYSPDGRLFAVWGFSTGAHFWDRAAGRELVEDSRGAGTVFDVDFAGDVIGEARTLAASRLDFYDSHNGKPTVPAIPYSGWPFLLRFSPDGALVLTTGRDRIGQVWDWRKGTRISPALPHEDEVMAGTFVPGQPWVVTGGHDGVVQFWDYRTGMPMGPPIREQGQVMSLQLTPDAKTLVVCGYLGGVLQLYHLPALFPDRGLDPEDTRLLAEIEVSAEVHSGGGLVPLSADQWMQRWKLFRQRHPDYPGHRLTRSPPSGGR